MKLSSFSRLAKVLQRGTSRFPLPILSASVITICLILSVNKGYDEDFLFSVSLIAGLGFVASLLLDLILEATHAHTTKRISSYLALIIGIALYGVWFVPSDLGKSLPPFWYSYYILIFCLHLGVALSPLLHTRDSGLIWQFNLNLFIRFVFSSVNAIIVYIGLALALLSIDKLFNVGWNSEIYLEIWFVCAFFFHPLLFLGGIARIEELKTCEEFPTPLRFSLKFVGLPLTALYLLIIYAYVGKILFQWNWPNGWVAMPIFILAVISLLAYLLSIPLSKSELWSQRFHTWLFRLLFPLSIVLILALQVRLNEYGMTINRYLGLALGVWLLIISLAKFIRPKLHVAWIPATLLIVTLISIYGGPFSAFALSERSQVNRIETLAKELSIWKDGRLVPTDVSTDSETNKEFQSSLKYIYSNFGSEPIKGPLSGYLAQRDAPSGAYYETSAIMRYLEIDDTTDNQISYSFYNQVVPTFGHSYRINLQNYRNGIKATPFSVGNQTLQITSEGPNTPILISANSEAILKIDRSKWPQEIIDFVDTNGRAPETPLVWDYQAVGWSFSFVLQNARLEDANQLQYVTLAHL
jgi:hypothetical protein